MTKIPKSDIAVLTVSLNFPDVTPAKAGVQKWFKSLDSGFRRNDD